MKVCNLKGQKFGNLFVIERKGSDEKGQALWLCKCDCGVEKIIRGHDLKCGTKSCGCSRIKNTGLYQHGLSKTKLHGLWRNIKDRCYNQKNKSYSFYGGRGIKMCDEWFSDFVSFYNWSYLNGYKEGLQIDRIDTNGDYSPENCRWVDKLVQANNTRRNVYVTINGETKSVPEWSRILGVNQRSVHTRISKGWDPVLALTTPFKRINRRANN